MIAHQESYSPAWHQDFVAMLPQIRQSARVAFLNLPNEARDEAIAEVVASCFVAYARLVELGKADLAYPTVLARYGVAQYRSGRHVGTKGNRNCVYSHYSRHQNGHEIKNIGAGAYEPWKEQLIENDRTPVCDQAIFRIDFPTWLGELSQRDRDIAEQLAVGHRPTDVARRFGLSDGRVSQLRREMHRSWSDFHGDDDLPAKGEATELDAINRSLASCEAQI
jgi:hypothetical protein